MSSPQPAPTGQNRRLRVFLCHASGDKEFVRDLYVRLKADGFAPWLDEKDLLPGQRWQEEIPEAVRKSDVVIVCISQKSVSKEGYLQREIRDALYVAEEKPEGTIFIIPARIEEVDVPKRLNEWQWADLFSSDGYERLVAALNRRAQALGILPISLSLQGGGAIKVQDSRREVADQQPSASQKATQVDTQAGKTQTQLVEQQQDVSEIQEMPRERSDQRPLASEQLPPTDAKRKGIEARSPERPQMRRQETIRVGHETWLISPIELPTIMRSWLTSAFDLFKTGERLGSSDSHNKRWLYAIPIATLVVGAIVILAKYELERLRSQSEASKRYEPGIAVQISPALHNDEDQSDPTVIEIKPFTQRISVVLALPSTAEDTYFVQLRNKGEETLSSQSGLKSSSGTLHFEIPTELITPDNVYCLRVYSESDVRYIAGRRVTPLSGIYCFRARVGF